MSAHIWALCCLAITTSPAVFAGPQLQVHLRNAEHIPDATLVAIKLELASLMQSAGVNAELQNGFQTASENRGDLVIVELRGSCAPSKPLRTKPNIARLGSSAVADGKVLPLSWVDCSVLTRMLEPHLTPSLKTQRDFVYGRAIARVIAHELYHVLGRTTAHTASGLAKAQFDYVDLLAARAEFGDAAIARLQNPSAPVQVRASVNRPINIPNVPNHENLFEPSLQIR
jgi:hypothetical protein